MQAALTGEKPELSRGGWPRRWVLIGAGAALALVLLVGIVWFSPLLAARTIEVRGQAAVPEEQIRNFARVPKGQPLLRVDTDAAARRVAALPRVAKARVQRVYPSTVRITVTERVAAVFFDTADGPHLMDADGVEFAIEPAPPGVPRLQVDTPGRDDPATKAVLEVLRALPPQLRGQLKEAAAKSISDIRLTLADDRVVLWGSREHTDRKASVAVPLLTQPGKVYDVSSPDLPVVKQ